MAYSVSEWVSQIHMTLRFPYSALQAVLLALHVFHHDIVDVAQGSAVFQHFPGGIGMEMNLDQILVATASRQSPSMFWVM